MSRLYLYCIIALGLAVLLTACSPTPLVTTTAGTAIPDITTQLLPLSTSLSIPASPEATPTLTAGLNSAELKYHILAEFPNFFFCDPDYYPVARVDELELALQRFPELQANPDEFVAILEHNNLEGLSTYTDAQKLLIYQEHKKLSAIQFKLNKAGYDFQIQIAEGEGRGELVSGTMDSQGKLTILERTPSIVTCPICLAAGSLIDSPAGPVPVEDLRLGSLVWTLDADGKRVAQPLVRLGKTILPAGHRFVHLVLDDGRQLWVSPGHPTIDGHRVGQLHPGDTLDGSEIRSAGMLTYPSAATFDLLPAGDTGFYWANGILFASSLKEE